VHDLRNLYQKVVLDHYKNPQNFHKPEHSNRRADGFDPLCGDKLSVYLRIEKGVIQDIGFVGAGCAISIASASMMTEHLKGKTQAEAKSVCNSFLLLMNGRSEDQSGADTLGSLNALLSVRDYPVRVKCATLAWRTVGAALEECQNNCAIK
jgi:nitrogen fixation NifU-like protein